MPDIRVGIREAIAAGRWQPGDKLPTFRQLMADYGLSKVSVDRALSDLESEGLLTRVRGSGIYVRRRETVTRDLISGWLTEYARARAGDTDSGLFEAMTGAAADVAAAYREVRTGDVPVPARAALGLDPGAPVLERTFTYTVEGKVHQVVRSYMAAGVAKAAGLSPEGEFPGTGTMLQLRQAGVVVRHVLLDLAARMPSAEETAQMGLPAGTPVFEHHRALYEAGARRAAEASVTVVRADQVSYRFSADMGPG